MPSCVCGHSQLCFTPRRGEYGYSTLSRPEIMADNEVSTMDGKRLIANGKSLVAALQQLKKEVAALKEEPEWVNPKLKQALFEGLRCDVVRFQDVASRIACYAMSHLQESNKYRETTLRTIRSVVQGSYDKLKDWNFVERDFVGKFGSGKIPG